MQIPTFLPIKTFWRTYEEGYKNTDKLNFGANECETWLLKSNILGFKKFYLVKFH